MNVKSLLPLSHSLVLRRHGWSLLLHPDPTGSAHWFRPLMERVLGGEDGGGEFSLLVCRYDDKHNWINGGSDQVWQPFIIIVCVVCPQLYCQSPPSTTCCPWCLWSCFISTTPTLMAALRTRSSSASTCCFASVPPSCPSCHRYRFSPVLFCSSCLSQTLIYADLWTVQIMCVLKRYLAVRG